MKKFFEIIKLVICSIVRFFIVLLVSCVAQPVLTMLCIIGIGSFLLCTIHAVDLLGEGGLFILGGIGLILLGVILFSMAFKPIFGDGDEERAFVELWTNVVPGLNERYKEKKEMERRAIWSNWSDD